MTDTNRKPGRPTLPPGAAKTARVELRVTPAVKAAWSAAAKSAGMTLQAWIERAASESVLPLAAVWAVHPVLGGAK